MNIDSTQEQFLTNPMLELNDIDNKSSIKTNFHIVQKNKVTLLEWLKNFKNYIIYLRELFDIDNIIAEVIKKLSEEKSNLTSDAQQQIGQEIAQTIGDNTFIIKRVDLYTLEITSPNQANWIVDNLIVQVKNGDGIIVYPVITTKMNKITLNFADEISSNYTIYWI